MLVNFLGFLVLRLHAQGMHGRELFMHYSIYTRRARQLCAMHSYTVIIMLRCMAPLQACFEFKGAAAVGQIANPSVLLQH